MVLLSIVTLNYKKPEFTISCLHSLNQIFSKQFREKEIELIIVDNASEDGSINKINSIIEKERYESVSLIESTQNSGFGKGCNIGAKSAKGKYLLFLNNDTVVNDDSILQMAKYMEDHKEVDILGGQLKNPDGSLQSSSGSFYGLSKAVFLLLGMQRFGLDKNPKEITKVDWVKGGLLMIKKDIFELLKGFDENIFMYTEDMELCFRAKQKGIDTYFYPEVNIVHVEHGSTNRTFAIVNIYKNLLYFYKKHKTTPEYLFLKTLLIFKAVVLIFLGTLFRNVYLATTYRQALAAIK